MLLMMTKYFAGNGSQFLQPVKINKVKILIK